MRGGNRNHKFLLIAPFFAAAALLFFSVPAAQASSTDNVRGWIWSGTAGWISSNCLDLGTCSPGGIDYGLNIDDVPGDPTKGDLSGWAWSERIGWICFGTTCGASPLTPEGVAPYAQFRRSYNGRSDQVWGWAKVVNLGTSGWISLNCANINANDCVTSSSYYVSLNVIDGLFSDPDNPEPSSHWAWNGNNDGTGIGWIEFANLSYNSCPQCMIMTTWKPAQMGAALRPRGVYEPPTAAPGTHRSVMTFTMRSFSASTGSLLECEMTKSDSSIAHAAKILTAPALGSDSVTYTVKVTDDIRSVARPVVGRMFVPWSLTSCRIAGPAKVGFSCNTDAECVTNFGVGHICEKVHLSGGASQCRRVLDTIAPAQIVFVHSNSWIEDDELAAKGCYEGSPPGNFFGPSTRCDAAGDVAFALAMRRGWPVQGDCISNPGDRYCHGVIFSPDYCNRSLPSTALPNCNNVVYTPPGLCCGNQPPAAGQATYTYVVDGTCSYRSPNDGYFDCDCSSAAAFNASATDDCYSPGTQSGEYCCQSNNTIYKTP